MIDDYDMIQEKSTFKFSSVVNVQRTKSGKSGEKSSEWTDGKSPRTQFDLLASRVIEIN